MIKASDIAKNSKHDGYEHALASMVYKFFNKKTSVCSIKNKNLSDQRPSDLTTRQLAEKLHKPIIKKFNKRKVQSSIIDNIWGADLSVMQLVSKFNKGFRFLLCATDI